MQFLLILNPYEIKLLKTWKEESQEQNLVLDKKFVILLSLKGKISLLWNCLTEQQEINKIWY